MKEPIPGVPLALSWDYDDLPRADALQPVRCSICTKMHEDSLRQLADGVRIMALMCDTCRAIGRSRWIGEAAERGELPWHVANTAPGEVDHGAEPAERHERGEPGARGDLPLAVARYRKRPST